MAARHADIGRFIRLSAHYQNDPRILRAGPSAELVYIRALAFTRERGEDGHIMREHFGALTVGLRRAAARDALEALLREELWESCADGWQVPYATWQKWQDTSADRDIAKQYERERKAEWRARQRRDQAEE